MRPRLSRKPTLRYPVRMAIRRAFTPAREDDDGGMVLSPDARSLRRGRRRAPRTAVYRPALVWRPDATEDLMYGVLLDLNPHGMRLRLVDALAHGEDVIVQMMRDEEFQTPLSVPIRVRVVRLSHLEDGLHDHGLVVLPPEKRSNRDARPQPVRRTQQRPTTRARMHTLDVIVGDRYTGRRRG
mgnify:CR=1 FL=1